MGLGHNLVSIFSNDVPHKVEAHCPTGVQGEGRQQGGRTAALPAEEGVAGPHGGFLNGSLRTLVCEQGLRSGINWMVTGEPGGKEASKSVCISNSHSNIDTSPHLGWPLWFRYGEL